MLWPKVEDNEGAASGCAKSEEQNGTILVGTSIYH